MNKVQTISTVLILFAAAAPTLGCQHEDQPAVTVPPPQTVDAHIVDRLSSARCDREETCNNVGSGRKYASRDVCTDQIRGDLGNDLNTYNCPRGIDAAAVDQCMGAIRAEDCGHPLDTLSRVEKCRTGAMCLK